MGCDETGTPLDPRSPWATVCRLLQRPEIARK
jgi:hypothetical protein